ncbi:MAG TPA: penicillin acylase family protein [Solirubrobacteraceae bacterium]|jgi:acyl-homoserine lactone acylase PvdQ|nr:penicillin acylase family protein [Solirubrobacteraceae bacterium]
MRRVATAVASIALAIAAAGTLAAPSALAQSAAVPAYGTDDFGGGGFWNILPPGTNGSDNLVQLALFKTLGVRPEHFNDQLQMYENLPTHVPITESEIPDYYKNATFGVPAGDVESQEFPEPGVTIEFDKGYGVPHIYGDTRAALMFGIGYATAQQRLFFIDVLRHYGAADLASFAGGSNAGMDAQQFQIAPYTQQDLQQQVNYVRDDLPDGQQIYEDALNYVAGINEYIAQARLNPNMMPGEYAAIGHAQGPAPFQLTDLIRIASLVGGIFGQGGGEQLNNAMLEEAFANRFGAEQQAVPGAPGVGATVASAARAKRRRPRRPRTVSDRSGFATFMDFDRNDDADAPTTVTGHRFPYETLPTVTAAGSLAMPDAGSVRMSSDVVSASGSAAGSAGRAAVPTGNGLLGFPRSQSNALLVSGAHTSSGHPIAVMGPQVAYFAPEILMEEDIHAPGIQADGAAFPGVNLYVELGHGEDYAWSATSAGQDIIDIFALALCSPSGGAVSPDSDDYVYQGRCLPMQTISQTESWAPNLGDSTPAGSQTLSIQRTDLGLVIARARIAGRPVVFTSLRSTYMHELDSAAGFERFNEPSEMATPQDFMSSADQIGYTFNWFFVNRQHIAYFNSGRNPVRSADTDPLFPVWGGYAWKGWSPQTYTEQDTAQSAHPQAVDQPFFTSWNNKQAPGYADGSTGEEFSSVYRSQLLSDGIESFLSSGQRMSLADLINVMGTAATQDLRGVEVLPSLLKVIGTPSDPRLASAVSELTAWMNSGAHRIDPTDSGQYEDSQAIQIMDAWWPLLVKAIFQPTLGSSLLSQVESEFPINDQPGHGTSGSHLGSSWDVGFYGVVQEDLRKVLGQKVPGGGLSRAYCGQGKLATCRSALESSLEQALGESAAQVYPADSECAAGNQECSDSINFRALGAVTEPEIPWQNRPTFQQAVQISGQQPGS